MRAWGIGVLGPRSLRQHRVGKDVMSSDGLVAPVQDIALPFADEHAFGRAGLISRVRVDWSCTLGRPADDLDAALFESATRRP